MKMLFTVASRNEQLLRLVRDFAVGLGMTDDAAPRSQIAVSHADASDGTLLHLLTHVALSATRTGTSLEEPLCQVTFHETHAASEVTLGLRIATIDLQSARNAG